MRYRDVKTWTQRLLFFIALIFGMLVLLEAWVGGAWMVGKGRPLVNAEVAFGVALMILLILRAAAGGRSPDPPATRAWELAAVLLLAALVPLTFWRTLHMGFLADDFILVRAANASRLSDLSVWLTSRFGDVFYRPLANLVLTLASRLAGWQPERWRIVLWTMHAANAILVYGICRSSLAARQSLFAASLFVMYGSGPESVVWITGLFPVVAVFLLLLGVLLFLYSLQLRSLQTSSWRSGALRLASWIAMMLALLTKESTYCFPFLLVLGVAARGGEFRRRLPALAPFFAGAAAVFAYRWRLLGGIGGYRDPLTQAPLASHVGLTTFNAVFARMWGILFFPVNWTSDPGPLFICLTAVYIVSLLWLLRSRVTRRDLLFPLGFTVLAALPAAHQLLIGPDLWKSRALYLPCVGFCWLLAVIAGGLEVQRRSVVMMAILAFHFFAVQHNVEQWEQTASKVNHACESAAQCLGGPLRTAIPGLPDTLRGTPFLGNGFAECVELALRERVPVKTDSPGEPSWDPVREEMVCGQRPGDAPSPGQLLPGR